MFFFNTVHAVVEGMASIDVRVESTIPLPSDTIDWVQETVARLMGVVVADVRSRDVPEPHQMAAVLRCLPGSPDRDTSIN